MGLPAGGRDFQRFSVFDSFAGPESRPAFARCGLPAFLPATPVPSRAECSGPETVRAGGPTTSESRSLSARRGDPLGDDYRDLAWRMGCKRAGPPPFFLPRAKCWGVSPYSRANHAVRLRNMRRLSSGHASGPVAIERKRTEQELRRSEAYLAEARD